MKRCLLILASLLSLAYGPLAIADDAPSTTEKPPLSPAAVTKLRSLLEFPEASLDPKMELSIGLRGSPEQGAEFFRISNDYAARIVAVRRTLTGGTADAARYQVLGGLYHLAGLPTKSKSAFQCSEALERAVLRKRPDDGTALAGCGQILAASGQTAAAEAFLRKATQIAPKSADVWIAFGYVLSTQATLKTEPTSHLMRQAAAAYDRAISLSPQNPAVWTARADFRTWSLPQFQGKLSSRDGLSDYERAALLSPNDPYVQSIVPSMESAVFEMAHGLYTSPEAAKKEPRDADRRAKKALRRITAIAQSTRGRHSASAYEARAWIQFQFFYDPKGAQKSLRLALLQNPRQQDAMDYQIHVAAVTGDYPLMAAASRREMRRHPAIRLRLLLASAEDAISQQKPVYAQDARNQLELAHAAEPNDYGISLGLAVLLLKSGSAAAQSRATLLLDKIAPQVPKRPKAQQAEYDVTRGVCSAQVGDWADSRHSLDLALHNDPHNQPAKLVLALLPE